MEVVAPTLKRPSCILWSEIEKWTPESVLLRFGKLPDDWRLLPVSAFAVQLENKEKVEFHAKLTILHRMHILLLFT